MGGARSHARWGELAHASKMVHPTDAGRGANATRTPTPAASTAQVPSGELARTPRRGSLLAPPATLRRMTDAANTPLHSAKRREQAERELAHISKEGFAHTNRYSEPMWPGELARRPKGELARTVALGAPEPTSTKESRRRRCLTEHASPIEYWSGSQPGPLPEPASRKQARDQRYG